MASVRPAMVSVLVAGEIWRKETSRVFANQLVAATKKKLFKPHF